MKTLYFAIFDAKDQAFGQLYPSATRGSAERSFQQSLTNPDSIAGKYPQDFALYCMFEFDSDTGIVTEVFNPPQLVVQASSLVS